jgi:DNA-binding response OmpR family regulator
MGINHRIVNGNWGSHMSHTILVVEDDREIADGVSIYLKNQGYQVFQASNGYEGLEVIKREHIHLAIVDIMMPMMDGITMTLQLRQDYDFPVIFLSAKSEEIDKVTGLNIGADDYVTKPFTPMELLARVNSQLRRYDRYLNAMTQKEQKHVFTVGGLELDENLVQVSVDGVAVKCTPIEFKILSLLIKSPGRVFSAEEIYERVWQERVISTETVMVHIRNIREKIEFNPKEPKYLKVVWGVGYKLEKQ